MRNASSSSAAWFATLLVTALVIGWPVLHGGHQTYLDNPAHLAEIQSLAGAGHGWSDIGFCGFPIGLWHSPLGYGLLALVERFARAGALCYSIALWIGFALPALVLFLIARRRLAPAPAGLLAYLLLIQPSTVHGIQSAFGGMWTFYIGAALFLLLCDRFAAADQPQRRTVIAAVTGLIGLTHVFPFYALAVLFCVHACVVRARRRLLLDLAAVAIGVLASAAYWLPNVLTHSWLSATSQNLPPVDVLRALVLPVNMLELTRVPPNPAVMHQFSAVEAIPNVLLIVLGLTRLVTRADGSDRSSTYGFALALTLVILLTTVVPFFCASLLGPISWRMLYFVRLGLALSAIPLLAKLSPAREAMPRAAAARLALPLLVVASGFGWAAFLRAEVPAPDGPEMQSVERLWTFLRAQPVKPLERCYVQDTFQAPGTLDALNGSHVLARTAPESGCRQVGAYYGVVPFPTARWTRGEYGFLFHRSVTNSAGVDALRSSLRRSNCRALVLVEPRLRELLKSENDFQQQYADSVFSVFRWSGADGAFCETLTGAADCDAVETAPGRIRLTLDVKNPGTSLLIKESFHPFWRLRGDGSTLLCETSAGLMQLDHLEPGRHEFALSYEPPRFPLALTGLGWLAAAAMGWTARRRSPPN